MELRLPQSSVSLARRAGALVAAALLVAACAITGSQSGASGSPGSSSADPTGSSGGGFYLRAWETQALAPQYTFTRLSIVTISDGQLIDGRVAIPAIYPGPLWIGPSARPISTTGIASIVSEARSLGLLGAKSDFTDGGVAGATTGHVQMVVEGVTYDLTGSVSVSDGVSATPGTAAAFEAFWQKLADTTGWLGTALGAATPYEPARLAVLAMPPVEPSAGINANEVPWPLVTPFNSFGTAYGGTGNRCAVVSGADLAKLLPVVKQSNQLTRFVDGDGVKDSLLVRVLVPGEASPCT
jgi:hypothetical protein